MGCILFQTAHFSSNFDQVWCVALLNQHLFLEILEFVRVAMLVSIGCIYINKCKRILFSKCYLWFLIISGTYLLSTQNIINYGIHCILHAY